MGNLLAAHAGTRAAQYSVLLPGGGEHCGACAAWKCYRGRSAWASFAWCCVAEEHFRARGSVCGGVSPRRLRRRVPQAGALVLGFLTGRGHEEEGETTRQDPLDVPPHRQHKEHTGFDTKGLFRSGIRRSQKCKRWQAPLAGGVCPCEWGCRCLCLQRSGGHPVWLGVIGRVAPAVEGGMALILGSVGHTPVMAQLLRASGVCWDWSVVVCEGPTVVRMEAFKRVCRTLQHAHV